MAFLSHSIHWHILSSKFEYAERKNPGPQYADIFVTAGVERKQIEHFLTSFQNVIREHSSIERKRFRSAREYKKRAREWLNAYKQEDREEKTRSRRSEGAAHVQTLQEYTAELRQRILGPSGSGNQKTMYTRASEIHERRVEGSPYHNRDWAAMAVRDALWRNLSSDQRKSSHLRPYTGSILELPCVYAATTTDPKIREQLIDTMFLFVHHPPTGDQYAVDDIGGYVLHDIQDAGEGLYHMVLSVSLAFVCLNLIASIIGDNPAHPLLERTDQARPRDRQTFMYERLTLNCRPAYMDTKSFGRMRREVGMHREGWVVCHVLLHPILYISEAGSHQQERNVFEDAVRLKADLKSMWKVLITCDAIFREIGTKINWEYVVVNALDELFHDRFGFERLFGMHRAEYESFRSETPPQGTNKCTNFWRFLE